MNLTKRAIAEKINVPLSQIIFWETGRHFPRVSNMDKLERGLELPLGTLQRIYCHGDTDDKRTIYVSYPFLPLENETNKISAIELEIYMKEVSEICRQILAEHNDVLVLSPLNALAYLKQRTAESLKKAMDQCKAMLELADELWVYGDWQNSEDCCAEIQYAELLKMPVRYKDSEGREKSKAFGSTKNKNPETCS